MEETIKELIQKNNNSEQELLRDYFQYHEKKCKEKIELTIEQTDKILKKLKDYGFAIIDKEQGHKEQMDIFNIQIISEDYFNEKVNEALKE